MQISTIRQTRSQDDRSCALGVWAACRIGQSAAVRVALCANDPDEAPLITMITGQFKLRPCSLDELRAFTLTETIYRPQTGVESSSRRCSERDLRASYKWTVRR